MIRVDFYLISDNQPQGRRLFACRLAEKAYHLKHRVLIYTDSAADSHMMDILLWTFREESFVPHNIYSYPDRGVTPIQIIGGETPKPDTHSDILINLSDKIPAFYSGFQRVIEIILNEPQQQAKGREHFRLYREQGCQLELHDMRDK